MGTFKNEDDCSFFEAIVLSPERQSCHITCGRLTMIDGTRVEEANGGLVGY